MEASEVTLNLNAKLVKVPAEPIDPPVIKNQLTTIQYLYHRDFTNGGDPYQITTRHSTELESDDQVYHRRNIKATTDLNQLDGGWVEEASVLVVCNDSKEETLRLFAGKIPFAIIGPGLDCRFQPLDLNDLYIKSSGESKYSVYVIPR